MKGILLAGGHGTRLGTLTAATSKHLLPVYDKPMVHYPLSTLMLMGLREVLIISTPTDVPQYRRLLGDGSRLGMSFSYREQDEPRGLADALRIAADWLDGAPCTLILGDNILYGQGLGQALRQAAADNQGATILGYHVQDASQYGVATLDESGAVSRLEEKPEAAAQGWAVPGLYIYDETAPERAAALTPSKRGELEITDLNNDYLRQSKLRLLPLGRGAAWLDAGTPESLLEASQFVATLERRQGLRIACLEEVAWRMGFIDEEGLDAAIANAAPRDAAYLETLRGMT